MGCWATTARGSTTSGGRGAPWARRSSVSAWSHSSPPRFSCSRCGCSVAPLCVERPGLGLELSRALVHRVDVVTRVPVEVEHGLLGGRVEADGDLVVPLRRAEAGDPELVADLSLEGLAGLR